MSVAATPQALCVTGSERTASALAARVAAHPDEMHEVRLDLLERVDDEALALLRSPRVVATCRRREEGGGFAGSEDERARLLERALAQGPGFLDVEAATSRTVRDRLSEQARGRTRIVVSFHGPDLARAEALAAEPGDVLKVAVPVADAAELRPLRRLLAREARPVVRIGMGDGGLLSRVLFHRFGSPWMFVCADDGTPTAPGQLTLTRARALRSHEAAGLTPLGVVGGTQILTSNGQRAYNALFAAEGIPFHYLPIVSARPEVLPLLEELGFAGVAVTMPAKVVFMGHVADLDATARTVGALNSVRLRDGRRFGLNTDLLALQELLPRGRGPALVLGAGGAARAAICALRSLGWDVALANRTRARAEELAPLGARAIAWEARGATPFSVLVNATPVGSDGLGDPMPAGVPFAGRTVLDVVVMPKGRPTPLLERAAAEGGRTVSGTEMWLRQGVLQMRALAGLELDPEKLREHLNG